MYFISRYSVRIAEVKEYTKEGMKQQLAELKDHMQSLKMTAMVLSMAKVMAMKKHAHGSAH